MKAIQDWNTTVNEIVEHIKNTDYPWYLYNTHVRDITHELWKYGYITKVKFWRQLQFWILKSVSKQSEIKLDNIE